MQKLFFCHIPKTAGSTFRHYLSHHYIDIFYVTGGSAISAKIHYEYILNIINNMDDDIIENVDCFAGHVPFPENFKKFKNFDFITFLRNPIERVISDYFFITSTPKNPIYHIVKKLSLNEYVNRNLDLQIDNLQTRFLSGKMFGEIEINDFEKAKENMLSKFSFIGISEEIEKSIQLFSRIFNIKNDTTSIKKINVTQKEKKFSQNDIETITTFNSWDIELYCLAKKHFYNNLNSKINTIIVK